MTLQGHHWVIGVTHCLNKRVWNLYFTWRVRWLPGSKMKKHLGFISYCFWNRWESSSDCQATHKDHSSYMWHKTFQYRSRTSFFARLGLVLRQRACISGKHSVPSSMLGISVVRKTEKRLDAFRPLGQSRKGEIFAGYLWNWCSGKPIHRSYLNLSLPSHLTDHSFWATRRTRDNGTLLLGMGSKTGLGAGKIPGPWGSLHSDHLL